MTGLLNDSRRKSMEAMWARLSDPGTYQAFQHFITHAPWDAERVWTRLRWCRSAALVHGCGPAGQCVGDWTRWRVGGPRDMIAG